MCRISKEAAHRCTKGCCELPPRLLRNIIFCSFRKSYCIPHRNHFIYTVKGAFGMEDLMSKHPHSDHTGVVYCTWNRSIIRQFRSLKDGCYLSEYLQIIWGLLKVALEVDGDCRRVLQVVLEVVRGCCRLPEVVGVCVEGCLEVAGGCGRLHWRLLEAWPCM